MRLENSRDLLVLIEFTDALGTLVYFLRMMGVVAEEGDTVVLQFEIETTVHTTVGLHTVTQFLGIASIQLCHSHSCHTVLDIDGHGLAEFHVQDILNR